MQYRNRPMRYPMAQGSDCAGKIVEEEGSHWFPLKNKRVGTDFANEPAALIEAVPTVPTSAHLFSSRSSKSLNRSDLLNTALRPTAVAGPLPGGPEGGGGVELAEWARGETVARQGVSA